jgi:hypothetical protein
MSMADGLIQFTQTGTTVTVSDNLGRIKSLLLENKAMLETLTDNRIPSDVRNDINNESRKLIVYAREFIDMRNKHSMSETAAQHVPGIANKFFTEEGSGDFVTVPIAAGIALMTASALSIYQSLNFNLQLQKKYLHDLKAMVDGFLDNQITMRDLLDFKKNFKNYEFVPTCDLTTAAMVGAAVFGGFYFLKTILKEKGDKHDEK